MSDYFDGFSHTERTLTGKMEFYSSPFIQNSRFQPVDQERT
jgi:hypothetical protein